ncbi:hypothetical protein IQ06DRAFT_67203 [Phaeosphaeriaceae sp. SRC1lsM3a]|nr:hypothetical protein IQ06DRAFT_67203 [Stagonospora sp. SRC1lsM3a]
MDDGRTSRHISVRTYKHKIVSLFLRQQPRAITAPLSSPFLALPYEVRIIVYSYLDTEPPLSPRFYSFGIYQSCCQVKAELDDIANKKLQSLCNAVAKTPSINAIVKLETIDPRHITVTLPYTSFRRNGPGLFRNTKWNYEVLVALHPLFTLHIDVLRIHFSGQHCARTIVPRHDTLRQRLFLQDAMDELLHKISSLIDYRNHHFSHTNPGTIHTLFVERVFGYDISIPEAVSSYPSSAVRAKKICLTWDLRPVTSDPVVLFGRARTYARHYKHLPRKQLPPRKGREKPSCMSIFGRSNRPLATCYRLYDMDHLVGEVGMWCPSRWLLNNCVCLSNNSPTCVGIGSGKFISSKGLGKEYMSGLSGMKKSEVQRVEKMVWEEFLKRQKEQKTQHYDLQMTQIEEGIAMSWEDFEPLRE